MSTPTSKKITQLSDELDDLRFTSFDQNPKGIRDRLFCLSAEVRMLEVKVAEKPSLDPKFFQLGNWECKESPTGECVYTNHEYDCCIFCGDPDERK